ncbi:MAG: divalent-cation tolerance protein CutA [Myxococcales bacterium]
MAAATHTRVVLSTVPNEQIGERIARALLEENLVACVNMVPGIRSLYRWQGSIQDDQEYLLVIKTRSDRYEKVEQRLRELHPYEVCEVLAFDVAAGSKSYLDWVLAETRDA